MNKIILIVFLSISSAHAITAQQVITAWKKAGLEVGKPIPLARKDYGMAPLVGNVSKGIHFFIPSLDATAGAGAGGRIFDVPNVNEAKKLANYYINMGKESAMLYSHVLIHKNIVVQINGDLDDAKVAKYKASLESLR